MQDMMVRYEEMKQKLEWTRLTLENTASQINQNDIKRAQQIQATVSKLKEKAEYCSGILKKKREREEQNASDMISENSENLDPISQGNSIYQLIYMTHELTTNTGIRCLQYSFIFQFRLIPADH